ncbi:MAG: 4-alpha-glucanotransferase, partial [Clostridia bacterium]|nr:4-alpha-glucanotransferase [Clostridia bacterium]
MRTSGILAAVSSLPSEYGIGTLGKGAFSFVDFLSSCGQTYWQILPVNPPGSGNSPYQAHSAFAGNPFLLDPLLLQKDGLLLESEREQLLLP